MQDMYNDIANLQEQIDRRPLKEEIKSQFDRLSGYVQIESFRTLQSIVNDKVDYHAVEELKVYITHL